MNQKQALAIVSCGVGMIIGSNSSEFFYVGVALSTITIIFYETQPKEAGGKK